MIATSRGVPVSMFQSLSGFPMSCNTGLPAREPLRRIVSIPIGFSNELQRRPPARVAESGDPVSIPIGFSNELQRGHEGCGTDGISKFQSLSGFPMSCNFPWSPDGGVDTLFQSLSGFPMSCNFFRALADQNPLVAVSIPIGFSNELQRATTPATWHASERFQSLSGFPMSCNAGIDDLRQRAVPFQSLSGFPMSCNSPEGRLRPGQPTSFNPYRVFQ